MSATVEGSGRARSGLQRVVACAIEVRGGSGIEKSLDIPCAAQYRARPL